MIYSLDTNVIIDLLKKREKTGKRFLEAAYNNQFIIAPYVFFELYYGFYSQNSTAQMKIFADIEKILFYPGLNETDVMKKAAEIAFDLKRHGVSDQKTDIFIAAWTIEADATLVTSNTKHFENIKGLKLVNWRE
jgi:tRNA(fMet)-specific endonuclease VapC